jgi:FKBP-type peptidyl-prolyl cis-trans isomerase FkpA
MRAIRLVSFVLFLSLVGIGCLKEGYNSFKCEAKLPDVTVPVAEITQVETYLTANNITNAVKHPAGFYYIIENEGAGNRPTLCTNVAFTYKGQLTNGTIFDQSLTNPVLYPLSQLIAGWQIGLQLIKSGGKIRLFLPPSLGYGSTAVSSIPANSVLIFDVTLVEA